MYKRQVVYVVELLRNTFSMECDLTHAAVCRCSFVIASLGAMVCRARRCSIWTAVDNACACSLQIECEENGRISKVRVWWVGDGGLASPRGQILSDGCIGQREDSRFIKQTLPCRAHTLAVNSFSRPTVRGLCLNAKKLTKSAVLV